MEFLHVFIYFFYIYLCGSLPIDDDSVIIFDDLTDNNIEDYDTIDVSDLGPEAFTYPKNESVVPNIPKCLKPVSNHIKVNVGDSLATWNESSLMNPEEMGGYAEGDILMPQYTRNGIRDQTSRWPNGHIPYLINGNFSELPLQKFWQKIEEKIGLNQNERDNIMKAIADYHRLTCLRFIPYSDQTDYIVFKSASTGCWSSVGRLGGRQEINLQSPGCVSKKGTILHEILHAVGFLHEQSRPERDDFVKINYNNIKRGSENNFKKSDTKRVLDLGIPYDYNSVMHYSEYAFSRNSQKTIEPKQKGMKLGQREGLSRGDVKKVNTMYSCKKEEPQTGWMGSIWQNIFGDKKQK